MTRDSLSEFQARQRIAAQLSTEEKVRRADYAIWTDGTYDNTKRQIVETLEQLARR
jgi:dephospho-CoA kinase